MFDRSFVSLFTIILSGGVALWLGIMISAAVAIPIVGFIAVIPAVLVVFSVREALAGVRLIPDGMDMELA